MAQWSGFIFLRKLRIITEITISRRRHFLLDLEKDLWSAHETFPTSHEVSIGQEIIPAKYRA